MRAETSTAGPAPAGSTIVSITRIESGRAAATRNDSVAAEEPLEIRVEGRPVAVVMRTPGHDREIAAGFLLTEGIIRSLADVFEISSCPSVTAAAKGNAIDVLLRNVSKADLKRLTRHVFTSSSCGVCGKATIEAVHQRFPPMRDPATRIAFQVLAGLTETMRAQQHVFSETGGLHAAALFDVRGQLLCLREDVGRHNAVDKVLGRMLLDNRLPLDASVLLVSGRVSFEIVQKALAARIPVVAAVSAPTSLAITFARESGQTLAGFVRDGGMNLYAGQERVLLDGHSAP